MRTALSHQELDQRSLALHRLIAEKIRRDPDLFDNVKKTLARWNEIVCANSQPYLEEWERLVDLGIEECLAVATEDSERATTMRQASPFCGILSNEERWGFLLEWDKNHGASDQELEERRQKMIEDQALLEKNDYFCRTRPHYTLAELLAQSDKDLPLSQEEKDWLNTKPVGKEIL